MSLTRDQQRAILIADLERWQSREVQYSPSPITDIRAHLRRVGVVQPPQRYPHAAPRLRYSNEDRHEGTSANMLVTYADGHQAIVPATTRKTTTRTRATKIQESTHRITAADLAPTMIDEA